MPTCTSLAQANATTPAGSTPALLVRRNVDALVDDMASRHGAIDCVFANAGISAGRSFVVEAGQLENIDLAAWDKVLRINLDGVLHTVRATACCTPCARRRGT